MSELPYIRCLGCEEAIFDPTRAVCPGCGRCPVCGLRRVKPEIKDCPECELPYCTCCGRCPKCAGLRYTEIDSPCECGHPHNAEKLADLIRYESVVGAESRPFDWGCMMVILALVTVILLILAALR